MTPNDTYRGRTAPLTSKLWILYIYSTNIGTEYFKHCTYSPFFFFQNAICFIILTYLVPGLFTFYILDVLKLKKKIIPAPKRLMWHRKLIAVCCIVWNVDFESRILGFWLLNPHGRFSIHWTLNKGKLQQISRKTRIYFVQVNCFPYLMCGWPCIVIQCG